MTQAHVICCNDRVEHVYIGSVERATEKLDELAQIEFNKDRHYWSDEHKRWAPHYETAYGYYRSRLYWHIHTVGASIDASAVI